MFMQNLRRSAKKHRGLALIIVALIVVSLVATFALGSRNQSGKNSNVDQAQQLAANIKYTEELIVTHEAQEGEKDYSYYSSLAGYYATLASYYAESSSDKTAATGLKAAENYSLALENAPAELNDLGMAKIYINIASNYWLGEDLDNAGKNFILAIEQAPSEWEIANSYANYLFYTQGLDPAKEYLTLYKEQVKGDTAKIEAADNLLKYWEEFMAYLEQLTSEAQGDDAANTPADGESDGTEAPGDNEDADTPADGENTETE